MGRLLREGEYLVVYIPPTSKALVFRVRAVYNKYHDMPYGPLPLTSGTTLPTYDGGTTNVPADGVLPARSYTYSGITFPYSGAYDSNDMWYLPKDYRERVFHVIQHVVPEFVRIDVQVPNGIEQARFQRDKVMLGVPRDFGFTRGEIEMIHLPELRVGYRYGNDTNMDVKTFVKFTYAEYVIEVPEDPKEVMDVLLGKVERYWFTYPVSAYVTAIEEALKKTYGYDGFRVPTKYEPELIEEYSKLIREVREVFKG